MQTIFKSKYPILEAAMNRGSTLPLALAVHEAGAYPSLCSWSYDRNWDRMDQDIKRFYSQTSSRCLHMSFELEEFDNPQDLHNLILKNQVPTIELIYGLKNLTREKLIWYMREFVKPMHLEGVKIFKRTTTLVTEEVRKLHFLDGFMLKGKEAAGIHGPLTVKEMFEQQKLLTPNALLIPYGGIAKSEQVREYLSMGAEIVAVGTALAFSKESTIKSEAKEFVVKHTKSDLKTYVHDFNKTEDLIGTRRLERNALEFQPYTGPDQWNGDENRTASLVTGLYDQTRTDGHLMVGYGIDHIKEIRSVKDIVTDLCS
jgi:NAD(P)H-dependent flavin oxidoreductase YrpB (nitropropane dioxygenase family)